MKCRCQKFRCITRKAHKNRVFIINPLSAKSIWVKVKLRVKVKFWVKVVAKVNVCVCIWLCQMVNVSVCVVASGFARCLC